MVLDKSRIFRNSLWTFVGQLIPLILLFFQIPILISNVGIERFGLFTILSTAFLYFNLFDFGIGIALTKFLSQSIAASSHETSASFIRSSFVLLTLLGSAGAVIVYFVFNLLLGNLHLSGQLYIEAYGSAVFLALVLPVVLYSSGLRAVLSAHQRLDILNAIDMAGNLAKTLLIISIVFFSHDLRFIFIIFALIQLLILFALKYYSSPYTAYAIKQGGLSIPSVWALIRYGGWMTVINIIGPIILYADRFLLGVVGSVSIVPYYTVPYDIASRFLFFPVALYQPFFPVFSSLYSTNRESAGQLLIKSVRFLLLGLFPVVLFLSIFAREGVSLWLGVLFADKSYLILQILSISLLINSVAMLFIYFIIAIGRPNVIAGLIILEFLLYFPVMIYLLKTFSVAGVAVACLLRVAFDCFLVILIFERYVPGLYRHVVQIVQVLLIQILCLIMAIYFSIGWVKILYFVTICVLVSCLIWKTVMDSGDRLWLKKFLRFQ